MKNPITRANFAKIASVAAVLNFFTRCGSSEASGGKDRALRRMMVVYAEAATYAKTIMGRRVPKSFIPISRSSRQDSSLPVLPKQIDCAGYVEQEEKK